MNKEKIVISGVNGFVGKHLALEIHNNGFSVIGIGQEENVHPEISNIIDCYYQADLVEEWPDTSNVKAVIHLAGLAAVGPSFDNPQKYINVNSAMVTNLCEYYIKQETKPRIVLVSSGAVYSPDQKLPINEEGEICYSSPYAVSKILNENQAKYYRQRGLDCIVVRPFNHIGPGQASGFILPDFYDRISSLLDNENIIQTGNIETKRDYTDVRDIVKAYSKIATSLKLNHNVYNICSGKSIPGSEIFNKLKDSMKLNNLTYKTDPSLVRPTDAKDIIGDFSRIKEDLGWSPQIDLQKTIADFIESKASLIL